MRVLFATLGSVGDVKPCLHLAMGLQRMGHDVILAANEGYRDMASGFGVRFVALSSEHDVELTTHKDFTHSSKGLEVTRDLLLGSIRSTLDFVEAHRTPGQTVLVAPTRVLGARIAQERWNIPLVSLHMAPLYLTSFDGYPSEFVELVLGAGLDRIRTSHGLPPRQDRIDRWQYSPQKVVGLFPQWFATPEPAWPPHTELLDFLLTPPDASALAPDLVEFLDHGDPPVVFSPGTYTRQTRRFFETALDVAETLGQRAILTPVRRDLLPERLPDTVFATDWVEYSTLLPKVKALVHAGGIGTCAEALRAGIPQLMVPVVFDQTDNARRVAELGAGSVVEPDSFLGDTAREAVAQLLDDRTIRARARALRPRLGVGPSAYGRLAAIVSEMLGTGASPPSGPKRPRVLKVRSF